MSSYICPACQAELSLNENQWRCLNNHCYDKHKKGYVNLLLAQNKRSKTPGDDPEMVKARRRYLEAGHYQPLADTLANLLTKYNKPDATILDAGCGEGYYTHAIAAQNPTFNCFGLDISKPAVAAACKYKTIQWSVASSTHAPFKDDSIDTLVSVFSRVDSEPFARILKVGGYVCIAAPDEDHLKALRGLIYETVRPYDTSKHLNYLDSRFKLVLEQRLETDLHLPDNQSIMDLLGMTPHAHRLPQPARERLAAMNQLNDRACFKIYLFEKIG